jgi:hypothetical protein
MITSQNWKKKNLDWMLINANAKKNGNIEVARNKSQCILFLKARYCQGLIETRHFKQEVETCRVLLLEYKN